MQKQIMHELIILWLQITVNQIHSAVFICFIVKVLCRTSSVCSKLFDFPHVLDVGMTRFVVPLCHRSVVLDGGMDSVVQFNSLMNGTTTNML